jgi:malate dehydrogenase (oxaloacetate-decarboxylating)(NADP+)
LAERVTEQDLAEGRLYPPLDTIRECSTSIAAYIAEHAYKTGKNELIKISLRMLIVLLKIGIASTYPEPEDKEAFIRAQLYDFNYDNKSALPELYEWPSLSKI